MEPPDPSLTRDEIIDYYIKTLAQVLGSEEEARMSIYSVSTKHYFAFGAKVSEEISYKIKPVPKVRWVLPDSYLDVKNKDYGGEPFIDGKAVPYDAKYHEEWVRNNQRVNEKPRRNDRPRSRNFERRWENRDAAPISNVQKPMPPREMPPNSRPEPGYNQIPNPQSNYAPNPGPGYQGNAQGYQGGPVTNGPSFHGGGSDYSRGNSGYQAGIPSGNVTGGPSHHGGNPAYQTGNYGRQGGNPSGSVVSGVNPSNQGGSLGYQGGFPANQGARPGYQGGFPPNQGGNPATQSGKTEYPGGNRGNNMIGGPSYYGGSSGYQGQNGSYQGGNPGHHGGGPDYHGSRPGYQGGTLNFRDGSDYSVSHQVQPAAVKNRHSSRTIL